MNLWFFGQFAGRLNSDLIGLLKLVRDLHGRIVSSARTSRLGRFLTQSASSYPAPDLLFFCLCVNLPNPL